MDRIWGKDVEFVVGIVQRKISEKKKKRKEKRPVATDVLPERLSALVLGAPSLPASSGSPSVSCALASSERYSEYHAEVSTM